MKRLKQIEETKQEITKALIKLLNRYLLSDITVSQITREAKIGRNTFYNHFKTKEEVLEYLFNGIVSEATKDIKTLKNLDVRELLVWKYNFLKNYPVMTILNKQSDVRVNLNIFRRNTSLMKALDKSIGAYKKEFIIGGMDYVTSLWLADGMKESPEEMANLVMTFIGGRDES